MREYKREKLDIKRLLEIGDFAIKEIAEQNKSLNANEFFLRIESFIETSPQIRNEILNSIGDEKAFYLKNLKATLESIGFKKLSREIDGFVAANEIRNDMQANVLFDIILKAFDALLERTSVAYIKKRFAANKTDNMAEELAYSKTLLINAMTYYDYLEENRRLRVLAVDDVAVALNTITSVLSTIYDVIALKNSSQVEKVLTNTFPDLFLLDIEMGDINGFELVPLIRSFERHKDTPIIFLTGNASIENLKDAVALGACDFIRKPVNGEVLLEKIQNNIVRKKLY